MTYHGKCNCGSVTARIEGDPVTVRQCWCSQCQRLAAGGPTTNAIFRTDGIELTGPIAHFNYTAASGNHMTQHFCGSCGTPIMSESSARPHLRAVRVGFLGSPAALAPTAVIWTGEAPDWAAIDPKLEQFAAQPPAPVTQD